MRNGEIRFHSTSLSYRAVPTAIFRRLRQQCQRRRNFLGDCCCGGGDVHDAVTALALWLGRIARADEVAGFVQIGADCYVEEADHHLIVGLIAPADGG
jgi:hypothetical protein